MKPISTQILLAAAITTGLLAQAPAGAGRGGFGGPPVKSPEVGPDNKVTLRLRAPQATSVTVTLGGRTAMTKDEQGVWSATVGPFEPDYYGYGFVVDGVSMPDPANPMVKPSVTGGFETLVHVPGPPSLAWETANVPHGTITHHFYHSALIGDDRDFYVYTPPGYDPSAKTLYPVLYLFHGLGDEASGWTTAGRANTILDNLIAQGKAKPMIMVNTLGYGVPNPREGLAAVMGEPEKQFGNFSGAVLGEVLPIVEKTYRAAKDRNSRAVAGLSMGGAETFFVGLNNIDKFAYVAGFSSAFVMLPGARGAGGNGAGRGPGRANDTPAGPPRPAIDPAVFTKAFPALDAKAASRLKLLYVACGVDDGLLGSNRAFKDFLKAKGIEFKDVETPGAHTWMVWRRNLTEIAPLLFR